MPRNIVPFTNPSSGEKTFSVAVGGANPGDSGGYAPPCGGRGMCGCKGCGNFGGIGPVGD
ncbi:MAG: hypothetical protein WCZ85_05265 [Bacilli bacterium]